MKKVWGRTLHNILLIDTQFGKYAAFRSDPSMYIDAFSIG